MTLNNTEKVSKIRMHLIWYLVFYEMTHKTASVLSVNMLFKLKLTKAASPVEVSYTKKRILADSILVSAAIHYPL